MTSSILRQTVGSPKCCVLFILITFYQHIHFLFDTGKINHKLSKIKQNLNSQYLLLVWVMTSKHFIDLPDLTIMIIHEIHIYIYIFTIYV